MKKILISMVALLISSLVLAGCTAANTDYFYAYDKGDCYTNRFDDVDDTLDLEVIWRHDNVYLTWDTYTDGDFQGYYVVRSESDNCPYYHISGDYLEYNGRDYENYLSDTSAESGSEYYYRVCVKTTDKKIKCGSVMKVEVY